MLDLTWPSDLGKGTITGRVLYMDADNHDTDRDPQLTPAPGTITVTPSVGAVRYAGGAGASLMIARGIKATLDPDGYVSTPGVDGGAGPRGLVVPATDDPDLTPSGFTYKVDIQVGGYKTSFNIAVPTGATVDLGTVTPVSSSGGTATVVDATTMVRAEAAAESAESAASRGAASATQARDSAEYAATVAYDEPLEVTDATVAMLAGSRDTATGALVTSKADRIDVPLSPRLFGAVGDGAADDTTALQATLDAAMGSPVRIDQPYRVTSTITVTTGSRIEAIQGGSINADFNDAIIRVTGDDVTIRDLTLTGSYTGVTGLATQRLIDARPTTDDGTVRLSNITIDNVRFTNAGIHGIRLRWVDGFRVTGCTFEGWGQAAIVLNNARNGTVAQNRIYHDGSNPYGSTYGINIAASESDYDGTSTDPGSEWIDVDGNFIFDTPRSGISNHGCLGVRVRGNTIRRCRTGVSGVIISPEVPVPVTGMIVSDNIIDSENLSTTGGSGVHLTGDGASSGSIVIGNTVRRHASGVRGGGITIKDMPGTLVSSNVIQECSTNAIAVHRSPSSPMVGNLLMDVWAADGDPAGIYIEGAGDYPLTGNTLARGGLDATGRVVNAHGVQATSDATVLDNANAWPAA